MRMRRNVAGYYETPDGRVQIISHRHFDADAPESWNVTIDGETDETFLTLREAKHYAERRIRFGDVRPVVREN